MFTFASLAVVPFTIVGSIFSVEFTSGGPPKNAAHFAIAMVVTFVVIVASYSFIYNASKNADEDILLRLRSGLLELGRRRKKKNIEDGRHRINGGEKV
jgi:hypothetical protein